MDIKLIRPEQFPDKISNYSLFVDGKKLIELAPNSSQKITLPSHTKYIQAKMAWCSSPKYYLDNEKYKKLVIKNTISCGLFKGLFLTFYYLTLGKNKYLKIEKEHHRQR